MTEEEHGGLERERERERCANEGWRFEKGCLSRRRGPAEKHCRSETRSPLPISEEALVLRRVSSRLPKSIRAFEKVRALQVAVPSVLYMRADRMRAIRRY